MGRSTTEPLDQGLRLLLLVTAMALGALLLEPALRLALRPDKWTDWPFHYDWLGLGLGMAGIMLLAYLARAGSAPARWLLVGLLVIKAVFILQVARRAGPGELLSIVETGRALLLLILALLLGVSRDLRYYLRDTREGRGTLMALGEFLALLWVLLYSRLALQTATDFMTGEVSAVLIRVPTVQYTALSSAALATALLAAAAYSLPKPSLRICAVLAPLLALPIVLVTPLLGRLPPYLLLASLVLALLCWRRLRPATD